MARVRRTLTLLTCVLASTISAFAGNIIVDNDEWTLSDTGFSNEGVANGTAYAQNVARFLTGASSRARIWINSSNFGLSGSSLKAALGDYTLTDSGTFTSFTLASLRGYSAIFLGGNDLTSAEEVALIVYIKAGGSVYIAAGTGNITGGGAGEAAQWNVILNEFSLNIAPVYNGIDGTFPTDSMSPVLKGVTQLFYDNGNSVNVTGQNAQIITQTDGQGLIGTYSQSTITPEPTAASPSAGSY
jgi:hypothetical protein